MQVPGGRRACMFILSTEGVWKALLHLQAHCMQLKGNSGCDCKRNIKKSLDLLCLYCVGLDTQGHIDQRFNSCFYLFLCCCLGIHYLYQYRKISSLFLKQQHSKRKQIVTSFVGSSGEMNCSSDLFLQSYNYLQ